MHKFFPLLLTIAALQESGVCISAEEQRFYSQYQQDQYVYEHFFQDKRNGVFVDVGAHDGILLSNTYFFEKEMGWTGICVEPIPEVFQRLRTNRSCACIEGCIFDNRDAVPFLKISGWAEMLSGIIANYDPRHVERIQWEIAQNWGGTEVIEVRCYNLTQLLLDHEIQHVDYLSIDTEGGEFGILQSIDFDQIDIEIIEVENNYDDPFEPFLESKGYKKLCRIGPDELYQKVRRTSL